MLCPVEIESTNFSFSPFSQGSLQKDEELAELEALRLSGRRQREDKREARRAVADSNQQQREQQLQVCVTFVISICQSWLGKFGEVRYLNKNYRVIKSTVDGLLHMK